jgi:cobalt/nickel transport system permease protein
VIKGEAVEGLALHIADGVIETPVAAGFAALAVAVMALCLARGRRALDDRLAPMAGLVAAFVFAAQMLNFPVLPGVSGHLVGGALAALLVGPWVAALCVSVVLVVQALVFADGGLSALGLNLTNMALVSTATAYLVIVVLRRLLPRTINGLAVTAFVASVVSVVAAAMAFVGEYWIGGGVELAAGLGQVAGPIAAVHLLIGIGEGLITAVTVVTVARVRPDLVYALRGARPAGRGPRPVPAAGGGTGGAR